MEPLKIKGSVFCDRILTAFIFGALNLYLFVYMGFRGFYNCTQKRKHASC